MVVHPIQFFAPSIETGNVSTLNSSVVSPDSYPIQKTFKQFLQDALSEVNELQLDAADASRKFAAGELENLHELMIALEEAKIAMQFTIEVRNRVIDAYQDLIRMQV